MVLVLLFPLKKHLRKNSERSHTMIRPQSILTEGATRTNVKAANIQRFNVKDIQELRRRPVRLPEGPKRPI